MTITGVARNQATSSGAADVISYTLKWSGITNPAPTMYDIQFVVKLPNSGSQIGRLSVPSTALTSKMTIQGTYNANAGSPSLIKGDTIYAIGSVGTGDSSSNYNPIIIDQSKDYLCRK
jgi:hypothetical protein